MGTTSKEFEPQWPDLYEGALRAPGRRRQAVPNFGAKVNILRALVRRGAALSVYRGTTISIAVR